MNKPIQPLREQDYPELQLVITETKTRRERLAEAYEKLHIGLNILIEKHKKSCE